MKKNKINTLLNTQMNTSTRRDFLRHVAGAGLLLSTINPLLGHRAFAQGRAKRVVFFYYPNGMVSSLWQPSMSNGSISNGNELSFCLNPLRNHHDKVIVCKNMFLTGTPEGGHDEAAQNILGGKWGLSDGEATADYILSEVAGNTQISVANLGVRTGNQSNIMISKRRNENTGSRSIPNNDPKSSADYLFQNLNNNNGGSSALREQVLETALTDIEHLKTLSLSGSSQVKVEENEQALLNIQSRIEQTIGDCNLTKTDVTDPYKDGATGADFAHWRHIPNVVKAQIENAAGALACGVTNVATLQLFKGNENPSLANYCFDECWGHIVEAYNQVGSQPRERWWNEHSSHTASHQETYSHAGQSRWYVEMYAYLLDRLQHYGILEDTIAVMLSEVGDGNIHGPKNGGVIVGGATNVLQTGRVVDCNHTRSTTELFVDLGTALGADVRGQNGWGGGGIII